MSPALDPAILLLVLLSFLIAYSLGRANAAAMADRDGYTRGVQETERQLGKDFLRAGHNPDCLFCARKDHYAQRLSEGRHPAVKP